ncbi:hypothetical protein BDV18DRAFT_146842 [Aspergillus unguis]
MGLFRTESCKHSFSQVSSWCFLIWGIIGGGCHLQSISIRSHPVIVDVHPYIGPFQQPKRPSKLLAGKLTTQRLKP